MILERDHDYDLKRIAHFVREGDISIEEALRIYARFQTQQADVFQRMAEEAYRLRLPATILYHTCAHCDPKKAGL